MLLSSLFIIFIVAVSTHATFICPRPNGFFSDASSSKKFYHCFNSISYHKSCPSGLSWSQTQQRCVFISSPIEPVKPVEEILNGCSKGNPCENGGSCEPSGNDDLFCLCTENYYGSRCEHVGEGADLSVLESIISGNNNNYEHVVENVLSRNNWTDILAVVDVTGSMQPCAAAVYKWMKLSQDKTKNIRYYVFFNDGDDKLNSAKKIGSTGGIYSMAANNLNKVLATMQSAMKNGNGGDIPENDIEAILHGIEMCPTCTDIIHIADNKATPRDLNLLNRVTKPIKVLTCQVDVAGVNPQLLNVADKTNGSLHTLDEDVFNLSAIPVGEKITIGRRTYRRTSSGFVVV
ncbi:unnamed protein product [Rotaria sordida]|uniref:Uncharacterized protein n=1 Tax=Rotaria sordida TaxID=392033 RepID=A0A813R6K7_9BILA|nr:unnamed protein product [Rotaria sordida]CAF3570614.1 unnamed protein product [Rotaria sordida]